MSGQDSQRERAGMDRRQFLYRSAAAGASLGVVGTALSENVAAQPLARSSTLASQRVLRVRADSDLVNVDPGNWGSALDEEIMWNVYEGLITYEPGTWKRVNVLAEEFTASPDGRRYTFRLKPGIHFHGGYGEVTASDVKFSFERIAGLTKPVYTSGYQPDWGSLQQVMVTGKYTGVIILKQPFAPLLHTTLPATSGYIVSKKAVSERGAAYATHPIGTGPYAFSNWTPGQKVTLNRFPNYGGANTFLPAGRPDVIEMLVIADSQAAQIALQTGAVDFSSLPYSAVDLFSANSSFALARLPSLDLEWVSMNTQLPKLQDVRVREAIRAAIDRPSVLAGGYENKAAPAYEWVPPNIPQKIGYWKGAPRQGADPALAKSLLKQAGVSQMNIDLIIPGFARGGTDWNAAASIMQQNLAAAGIQLNVKPLPSGVYQHYALGQSAVTTANMVYSRYGGAPDPFWILTWFECSQIGQYNWMEWCNTTFDSLLNGANITSVDSKRSAMYIQMQQLLYTNATYIPIAYPVNYYAWRKGLRTKFRPDGKVLYSGFKI